MDYPPRYSDSHLNSESSTTPTLFPQNINNIYHKQQQHYCCHTQYCVNNMLPVDEFERIMLQRARQKRADMEENIKNSTLGSNNSTKQSLNSDSMNVEPKKESLWQSMFKSASNLLGEHLSHDKGSFIKSWTSMASPLSVTVVSPELYKNLHANSAEESNITDGNSIFPCDAWCSQKDSNNETVTSVLCDTEILASGCKVKTLNYGDFGCMNTDRAEIDKRWKEYKCMYIDCNNKQEISHKMEEKKSMAGCQETGDLRDVDLESIESVVISDEKDLDKSANFGCNLSLDDKPEPKEVQAQEQSNDVNNQEKKVSVFKSVYRIACNTLASLVQPRSTSPETDELTAHYSKRVGSCPKPKKVHAASSGKGRGRAKSQLRRSGVSQRRHRKERSRYDRSDEIKFDIKNWEDIDIFPNDDEEDETTDVVDFSGGIHSYQQRTLTISLENAKPMKKKQKQRNENVSAFYRSSSESSLDNEKQNDKKNEDESEEQSESESEEQSESESEDDNEDSEDDEGDDESNGGDDESNGSDDEEEFVQFSNETRNRLASTCSNDSEDSFIIVFHDDNEDKTENGNDENDSDGNGDDEDDSDENDDDETDDDGNGDDENSDEENGDDQNHADNENEDNAISHDNDDENEDYVISHDNDNGIRFARDGNNAIGPNNRRNILNVASNEPEVELPNNEPFIDQNQNEVFENIVYGNLVQLFDENHNETANVNNVNEPRPPDERDGGNEGWRVRLTEEWVPTKVRFDFTPTVRTIIHWKFAYKASRRGPWEQMARDNQRFRRRISETGRVLKPILADKHRVRIWKERFSDGAVNAATSSI